MTDSQVVASLDKLKCDLTAILNSLQGCVEELNEKVRNQVFEFLHTNKSMNVQFLFSEVEKKFSISKEKAMGYVTEYIHSNATKEYVLEEKPVVKLRTSSGIRIWNSFVDMVREEMGPSVKYEDVVKKARAMKQSDPSSYTLFAENWTP